MKRVRITVRGAVQGVGFRASAETQARSLGVSGYVRNLASGAVEIVAEGDERPLRQLVEWAKVGPPSAEVEGIEVDSSDATSEFAGFAVRQ
jgi:acylphosphatase